MKVELYFHVVVIFGGRGIIRGFELPNQVSNLRPVLKRKPNHANLVLKEVISPKGSPVKIGDKKKKLWISNSDI